MKRFRFALLALFLCAGSSARQVPVTIIHTTDLHGFVDPGYTYGGREGQGGFLRCAHRIQDIRTNAVNSLYIDCGDLVQGSLESSLSKGRVMTRALECMSCDAWVPGNHEFDWGLEALTRMMDESTLCPLAANLTQHPGLRPLLPRVKPYQIFTLGGIRIAVIGLTTPGIPAWSRPFLIGDVWVRDSVETLREILPELRGQVELLIVAAHQGLKMGGDDFANQLHAVSQSFPEIDVLLGGHSHQTVAMTEVNGILFSQAGYHAQWVGQVDLVYDTVERKVIHRQATLHEMDGSEPVLASLEEELLPWLEPAREKAGDVVGELAVDLPGRSPLPGHSLQQQLICDAIQSASGADFVLHGAFCKQTFPAGEMRVSDLFRLVPYDNRIGLLQITKQDLIDILEENAQQMGRHSFLGHQGFQYALHPDAPEGHRVQNLRLSDGQPLHPRKRYTLALNSYVLASGGQRYMRIRQIADDPIARLDWLASPTREVVSAYLQTHRPVRPQLSDGLTIIREE